jgi:hypothetical protein
VRWFKPLALFVQGATCSDANRLLFGRRVNDALARAGLQPRAPAPVAPGNCGATTINHIGLQPAFVDILGVEVKHAEHTTVYVRSARRRDDRIADLDGGMTNDSAVAAREQVLRTGVEILGAQ